MKILTVDGEFPYVLVDDNGRTLGRWTDKREAERNALLLREKPLLDAMGREME
jgi:type IV secretory pathway protease TraF